MALFSLEMSETELAHRFIASQAKVSSDELRKGRVRGDRWPKVLNAVEKLASAPIFLDDSSDIGVLEMRAKARRLHARNGLGLIVVDYLQLVRADGRTDSRVEQVGQISRGLKILARELEIPVVAVSQLSRAVESRNPPVPMLSDLRESGQLEQDADLVMFVYREDYYDDESERTGEADVIIAKHRNGPDRQGCADLPVQVSAVREPLPRPLHGVGARRRRRAARQRSRLSAASGPGRARGRAHLPVRRVRRRRLAARRGHEHRPALPLPRAARPRRRAAASAAASRSACSPRRSTGIPTSSRAWFATFAAS